MRTYTIECIIVLGTMQVKIFRYIEAWFLKYSLIQKHQRNENSPSTAITIQKGMNAFKLIMNQCRFDQSWHIDRVIMDELLQIRHQLRYMYMCRRYI